MYSAPVNGRSAAGDVVLGGHSVCSGKGAGIGPGRVVGQRRQPGADIARHGIAGEIAVERGAADCQRGRRGGLPAPSVLGREGPAAEGGEIA